MAPSRRLVVRRMEKDKPVAGKPGKTVEIIYYLILEVANTTEYGVGGKIDRVPLEQMADGKSWDIVFR